MTQLLKKIREAVHEACVDELGHMEALVVLGRAKFELEQQAGFTMVAVEAANLPQSGGDA